MTDGSVTKLERLIRMGSAFSPAAPVDDIQLFAWRPGQVETCAAALFQRGRHIGLYGERGVGKTSLANVIPKIIERAARPNLRAVRVDCNVMDSFQSIWRKVFKELARPMQMGEDPDPEDIRREFQKLEGHTLIVIDELDRMEDDSGLSLLSDTIKTLSDHSVQTTLMLVGVADSLMTLLGEHESIARSMVQVQMPRMSEGELVDIIDKGMQYGQSTITTQAKARIVTLSEGLPHFTHLLTQMSGERVIQDDRREITLDDVNACLERAVDVHSIRSEYDVATSSPQPGHLFEVVLLACAYAARDELGYFRPADVRMPLSIITGRHLEELEIATFQNHLGKFSESERGSVFQRDGEPRKYRYRFRNPLLQPYAKIRAISKGMITEEQRAQLDALRFPRRPPPFPEHPPPC